jgi:phytoene/squalene synthetase
VSAPDLSPCAALVRRGDPDRFLSALTAPPDRRERLFALYAFNLEIARVAGMVSEPMLGLIRLQWWREALDEIFSDAPVRRHEVATPLAETIRAADLPRAPFDRMLDARARDLEPEPPADGPALHAYLEDTGGALLTLAAGALSPEAGQGAAARRAGFAFAAANLLEAAPTLIARGAAPFPREEDDDAAARALAEAGLAALADARAARGATERAARAAFAAGWRAESILRRAARDGLAGAAAPSRARLRLLWVAATGRW